MTEPTTVLHRKFRTFLRLIREDRKRLWSQFRIRMDRLIVFGADVAQVPLPPPSEGLVFRKLSDDEVNNLAEEKSRMERVGFNGAHAVFCDGELAHISWLVTPEHEARTGFGVRALRLRHGEMEITACYTFPKFRGRGIYGYAIHSLCQVVRSSGGRKVFMKTTPQNHASQRGISKAGLLPLGRIIRFNFPLVSGIGLVYGEHRLPWNTLPEPKF